MHSASFRQLQSTVASYVMIPQCQSVPERRNVRMMQAISEGSMKKWIKGVGKALDCKGKRLFMPIRIALTGQMAGPDVGELLQALHKAEDGEILVDGYVPLEQRISALKEWVTSN
jgi:glutamyl/glutaminyl-tRNA synthetase